MARRYPSPNPLKLSGFELGSRELALLSNQTASIDSKILDDCSSGESDGIYGQTNEWWDIYQLEVKKPGLPSAAT